MVRQPQLSIHEGFAQPVKSGLFPNPKIVCEALFRGFRVWTHTVVLSKLIKINKYAHM